MKPKDWLTVKEVQAYVRNVKRHWSRTYVRDLVQRGRLKSFKIGHARFFLQSEVDTCLKSLKRKTTLLPMKKQFDILQ